MGSRTPAPLGRIKADQFEDPSPWWGPESRNAYLVAPNEIAFFDPRIPAWFRLYLNPAGEPVRLGMIAAAHFMTEYYSGFDKPLTVTPP